MKPLIKYHIDYYIRSAKYLPPLLVFAIFLGINYQTAPIGVWSNLHITSVGIFIFASWIGVTFVNCEHKTQQFLSILHTGTEDKYHLSKVAGVVVLLLPFYVITLVIPLVGGLFTRSLTLTDIVVCIIVYLLAGLMGAAVGVLFNSNIFAGEFGILAHMTAVGVSALPFNAMFEDNFIIGVLYNFVPPVNFLAQKFHALEDGVFVFDLAFFGFIVWALAYAAVLILLYKNLMRRGTAV